MWSTFRVAASGLQAQERALDVTSNNLANLQTVGYKSRRAAVVDTPPGTTTFALPGQDGGLSMGRRDLGQGVTLGGVVTNLAPGAVQATGRGLDVAIAGDGLLAVSLPDGRTAYTRAGALTVDGAGRLVTGSGALVAGGITVPAGATDLQIEADGRVTAAIGGASRQELGQLQLVRFTNPDGLQAVGSNLLVATDAAGAMQTGAPGSDGLGALVPGSLEASNVDPGREIVRVLQAQRAYAVNLRALKTVDEMLQDANNMQHQ
ncbi:MAG TPA: flagellar hook basal-body protein [Chloroflexota bacterium]|nr:flagellar hook basal-body protein [Chloroflexota bacterium]